MAFIAGGTAAVVTIGGAYGFHYTAGEQERHENPEKGSATSEREELKKIPLKVCAPKDSLRANQWYFR